MSSALFDTKLSTAAAIDPDALTISVRSPRLVDTARGSAQLPYQADTAPRIGWTIAVQTAAGFAFHSHMTTRAGTPEEPRLHEEYTAAAAINPYSATIAVCSPRVVLSAWRIAELTLQPDTTCRIRSTVCVFAPVGFALDGLAFLRSGRALQSEK